MQNRNLTPYALLSVLAAVLTIALKFAAYALTGAVGLFSDAVESLVNLLAAGATLLMLHLAAQPPDDEHAFGHDKAEFFSSGFEGGLILIAAAGIAYAAIDRMINPAPVDTAPLGLALATLASAINFGVARVIAAAGVRERSIALQADAQHLMTDVWTSIGVLAGMGLIALTGWQWIDIVISLAVAAHIVVQGVRLIRRSALGLLDTAIPQDERAQIMAILDRFSVEGVTYHALRTRQSGTRRFVSVHVLTPGDWTVRHGHAVLDRIEREIQTALPNTIIGTHLEPAGAPESFTDVTLDGGRR